MSDEIRAELQIAETEAMGGLDMLREIQLEKQEDLTWAQEMAKETKREWARWEERRKEITKPLNAALRSTNDLFRPILSMYSDGEKIIKDKIAGYVSRDEAKRIEAMVHGDTVPPPAELEGVTVRKVATFSVINADAVPREFCSPDPEKIQAAIALGVKIPGVTVGTDSIVSVRK